MAMTVNSSSGWLRSTLLGLMILYAVAATLPLLRVLPSQFVVAANILPPALFAFLHGSWIYRLRGMLAFTATSLVIGNVAEQLGIRTGFPFGSYYFTDVMGPKLLGVPLLMGPAYLAIGYTSWLLALLIGGGANRTRPNRLAVPLLAACIMVVWDLSAEAMWSTVGHFWIWRHGGPYFGVPIWNFVGWLLTNYAIFQSFTFYLSRRPEAAVSVGLSHWRLGLLSYAIVILAGLARSVAIFRLGRFADAAGVQWAAQDIALSSAMVSFFVMGPIALAAWVRISHSGAARQATGKLAENLAR